jgi:nucleotide-binding universal stress UspA family protein
MFSKILVGIDGSDFSLRALEHALFLKEKCGSSVTAVHVVPLPPAMYGDDPSAAMKFLEYLETNGQKILSKAKELAEKKNLVIATVMIERADPADEILKLSEKDDYDLIVLGSRGLSGIRKFLLGSVSSKVNEHAKCAVLTVK